MCRAGLRPYRTRWRTHARGFPARSRPPDGHRHPTPFAAPPCSSLRSCGAASRRTAQGRALGRASPRVCGRRQWVGEAIARAASDRPTARHAGGSRWERQPESEADSPRSDARYERAPSAATLARIARVCPVLPSLLAAGTGQRRKISYEGPHGSGCCAYPKNSRRRKIPPTCPFFVEEAPRKHQPVQRVITSWLRFRTGERR